MPCRERELLSLREVNNNSLPHNSNLYIKKSVVSDSVDKVSMWMFKSGQQELMLSVKEDDDGSLLYPVFPFIDHILSGI